jgi:hypothetical protein
MAIQYSSSFNCKTLQILPKSGFLVWKYTIWQPCSWQWCTFLSKVVNQQYIDFVFDRQKVSNIAYRTTYIRVANFLWHNIPKRKTYQNGKLYHMTIKYTTRP